MAVIVSVLAFVHFARRMYETAFVSVFSETTISIVHYITGFAFYASCGLATANLLLPTRRALPRKLRNALRKTRCVAQILHTRELTASYITIERGRTFVEYSSGHSLRAIITYKRGCRLEHSNLHNSAFHARYAILRTARAPVDISFDCLAVGLILYTAGSIIQYQSCVLLAEQRRFTHNDGMKFIGRRVTQQLRA